MFLSESGDFVRGIFFIIPTILIFLLLLAVLTFGLYGNVEVFNGDYIVNIELDSLSFAIFTYGSVGSASPRVQPLVIENKVHIVSYYYTNFDHSSRISNQFILCLINDVSNDFASLSELEEFLQIGGTLRLGKNNLVRGFILPGSFTNIIVDSPTYNMLPDVYYKNYGEFPSFYELQSVRFDVLLTVSNGTFESASWSFPEGEAPSFNLYVSPYYWFKGTIFYYDYLTVEFSLPIFSFEFPTLDGVSDIVPFMRSVFEFISYVVDYVRTMFRSTINFIGSMFYGIAPLKFIYYN